MMRILFGYLAIGAAILIFYAGKTLFKPRPLKDRQSLGERLAAMDPDRHKLSYKLLHHIVAPFFGSLFMVTCWPLLYVWLLRDHLAQKKREAEDADAVFRVEEKDLLGTVSIEEIEAGAMIIDPMMAVPAVPFGHLHKVWVVFKESLDKREPAWRFRRMHKTWGCVDCYEGYVRYRENDLGTYFITSKQRANPAP